MLARSGSIPTRGDWAYEVKWDGFRAIVSTEGRFRVRSRRGWDMTSLVPELAALPVFATLDGELCAFGPDGSPVGRPCAWPKLGTYFLTQGCFFVLFWPLRHLGFGFAENVAVTDVAPVIVNWQPPFPEQPPLHPTKR
jgi:hypothetical protein